MNWALSKGRRKVVLLRRMAERYKHFGGVIDTVTEVRYRRVLISANGIMRQSMKKRI